MPVYHVLTLKIPQQLSENAYALLYDEGCAGIVEEDSDQNHSLLKAYFEDHPNLEHLRIIASTLSSEPFTLNEIGLNSHGFNPAPYDPFKLTETYWVSPPDHLFLSNLRAPESSENIIIQPGVAFGTGRHQTTRLCSLLLESMDERGSLLDVGTGSGILAILGIKLGFNKVDAVEISEEARQNAQENFKINQTPHIPIYSDIKECYTLQAPHNFYDVVVANILSPTIIYLKDELIRCLKPQGQLILSGITSDEAPTIRQNFKDLKKIKEISEDDWVGFLFENTLCE